MIHLSLKNPKQILISGIGLAIVSFISGYFSSMGTDLWKLTKEGQIDLSSLMNPFWLISVPMGIISIILLAFGIYIERQNRSKDKEEIYKPLRQDVEKLVDSVKDFKSYEKPLTFWKDMEGRISFSFYSKLEDIFEKRFKEYSNWLKASQEFIRYKIYFLVNNYLNKLQKEYEDLGVGSFENHLYESLSMPVIRGDALSIPWFEEYDPKLWVNIVKCAHSEDIRRLLEWLREPNPCIESLKRAQSDLIKLAETLKDELNRKIK